MGNGRGAVFNDGYTEQQDLLGEGGIGQFSSVTRVETHN